MVHAILELASECPYADWARPNLRWCEAMTCGYIVTPLNAYSNIAYLITSYLILSGFFKKGDSYPFMFSAACAACGVGSFVYHATYTFLFQMADFLGMFAFTCMCLAASTSAIGKINMKHYTLFLLSSIIALVLCLQYGIKYQAIIAIQIVSILVLERGYIGKDMLTALFFMITAGIASATDQSGLFCEPHSWIQGHAIWHVLSGTGLFFTFLHYNEKRTRKLY